MREEVPEEKPPVTLRPDRTESLLGDDVEEFLAAGLTEVGMDTDPFTANGYLPALERGLPSRVSFLPGCGSTRTRVRSGKPHECPIDIFLMEQT